MTQKQRAIAVTVFAVVLSIVVGIFAFRESAPEKQPDGVILQKQDMPARIVAFGGFVVALGKVVWDVWAALERTISKPVNKVFAGMGTFFGVEVYNPTSERIHIRRVQLVVKLANQPVPQTIDLRTGEDAKQTSCIIEGKETADFFCPASHSLAREKIESIFISVETPVGRVEYLSDGKVRPVLLQG